MAVLKDLIVHGRSQFINGAQFNSLGANKISAEEGIFNKLVATNLEASTASITDLTATNAKIIGLLDVKGELHTNKWTNSNISNIGGSFYISPTVSTTIASGNTPMSVTITGTANDRSFQVSGGNFTTDAVKIYENDDTHSVYATGTTPGWPVGSHVMVTGNIRLTSTGVDYPLGTLTGYLTAYLSQNGFTVGGISSPALETIITELGTSNLESYDISISMFEIGPRGSNTLKPVGIMMTSYGVDKSTYMDIYGGVNTKTTDSATGFTIPNVRIGYLGGLPAYTDSNNNSHQPVGWGIYTDNGYFKGVVVADSGLVGGFTISAKNLYSGDLAAERSVWVSVGTDGYAAIGGSEEINKWAFTASDTFGVTQDGFLYASEANIEGSVIANAGNIGGCYIEDGVLKINNAYIGNINMEKVVADSSKTFYTEKGVMEVQPPYKVGDFWIRQVPIEKEQFRLTEDVTINDDKQYYMLVGTEYQLVTNPIVSELNIYYEYYGVYSNETCVSIGDAGYFPTTDTQVVVGKTYYIFIEGEYEPITFTTSAEAEQAVLEELYDYEDFNLIDWMVSSVDNNYVQSVVNPLLMVQNDYAGFLRVLNTNPICLEMGAIDSPFRMTLDSQQLSFYNNNTEVAHFSGDSLHVQQSISFGNFLLYQRSNGHLTIQKNS